MTTNNIDESGLTLMRDSGLVAKYKFELAKAQDEVRSQQKRIAELEREAESTISQLRQVQVRMNYWHDRTGEAEAKLSAIYKAVADDLEFLQYRNTMAMRIRLLSILDTVKGAPAQKANIVVSDSMPSEKLIVSSGKIKPDGSNCVMVTNIAPAKQPYNKRKIADELTATAQGDSYYGNALYVALDLAEGKDKEMLHRYLHGSELTSDKFALQEFANRLAQQPEQGE